jgi:hypothetical protein
MRISKFSSFFSINEATLDNTKINIDYLLSRPGRESVSKFGITQDMTLSYSTKKPLISDIVLWIKSSSIQQIKFKDLKEILEIKSMDDLMVYKTTSKAFPWAIAKKGIRTTMLRQKIKEGASKRGDHFRESAFIITFAIEAWKLKKVKIPVITNRGIVEMEYKEDTANISNNERSGFRNEYESFMTSNKGAVLAMIDQCHKLIQYIGKDINNIAYVIKNTSDLVINVAATYYLKDEIELSKNQLENDNTIELPKRLSLAKWNPSDIWIIFKGSEWTMEDFEEYDKNEIFNIDDLNEFLMTSIVDINGLIGVSLKQSTSVGKLSMVNINQDNAIHTYNGYELDNSKKTVTIKVKYKFGGKKVKFEGNSEIQCRTFDTLNNSNISLEIKGSSKAKHMSGKAGSVLASVMPKKYYEVKEFIRTSTSKKEISSFIEENFDFYNQELMDVFYNDISSGSRKTSDQNSRMQSIIVLEWIESLRLSERNQAISKIIKFAKSESSWSSPHLLAK